MLDLSSRTQLLLQGTADTLNGLPWWVALLVLFIPALLALATRQRWIVAATTLLNAASLVLLSSSIRSPAQVIIFFALSLVVVLFGFREHERVRRQAALEERLGHVGRQMSVFLEALDRRTVEIERMRDASLGSKVAASARPTPATGVVPAAAHQTSVSFNPTPPQST